MQMKNQWKGSKNWKIVTGVATAATLGFGAVAVAAPGADDVPHAINLNDRAIVSEQTTVPTTGGFVAFDLSIDDSISAQGDLDASPSLDDTPSVDDSPSIDDSISQDSLDVSPQASVDDSVSVQDGSFDSVSTDSFDSVDSADDSD